MKTMIQAGRLRHKVTIEAPSSTTSDPDGHPVESYSRLDDVFAAIEDLRGREFFEARALLSEQTVRFRMRYYPGLTTRHRLVFGSEKYKIESISNSGRRNRELEVVGTRIGAGGG